VSAEANCSSPFVPCPFHRCQWKDLGEGSKTTQMHLPRCTCHIYRDVKGEGKAKQGRTRRGLGWPIYSLREWRRCKKSSEGLLDKLWAGTKPGFQMPLQEQHPLTKTTAGIAPKASQVAGKVNQDPVQMQSRPGQDMTSTTGMAHAIRVHLLVMEKNKNAKPAQQSTYLIIKRWFRIWWWLVNQKRKGCKQSSIQIKGTKH
jgi:hypothetical protein